MANGLFPPCLSNGKHEYMQGVCVHCGEDSIAALGWGRFRVSQCGNPNCRLFISALAVKCPRCHTQLNPTFVRKINRFYWNFIDPFRKFFVSPRPSGLSIFEQATLVILTMLGVLMSSYIREDIANAQNEIRLREIFAAFILSLLVIPSLIKEPKFMETETPFMYRMGLALQKGVFSDLVIQGVQKGLGS